MMYRSRTENSTAVMFLPHKFIGLMHLVFGEKLKHLEGCVGSVMKRYGSQYNTKFI